MGIVRFKNEPLKIEPSPLINHAPYVNLGFHITRALEGKNYADLDSVLPIVRSIVGDKCQIATDGHKTLFINFPNGIQLKLY